MVRSDMFSNHLINNKNEKYNSLLFEDILIILNKCKYIRPRSEDRVVKKLGNTGRILCESVFYLYLSFIEVF